MGREILYCHRCGKQLLSEDFTRGRAMTVQNRCYCLKCLPEQKAAPAPVPAPASTRKPLPKAAEPARSGPSRGMLMGLGAAALAVVLIAGWLLGSADRTPPAAPVPPDRGARSETAALAAIRDAKEISAKGADNPAKEVELWQKAVWASESLPSAVEAQRGLARAKEKLRESWSREDREIETRFQGHLKAEQFVAAKALVEEALKRHDDPAWTAPMKRRLEAIQTQAVVLYPQIREKAAAAKTREDVQEVADLRKRIEGWGLPDYVKTFDADLAKVPDPMRAGAAKGVVTVLVGKPVERTIAHVKADGYVYGPKQEVLATTGETHVFLPYGKGDYYHESQNVHITDAAPGTIAQVVSKDTVSGVRLTYKVRFDQPISSFRLRCSNGEIAPTGTVVAGIEYSVDGKTWVNAVEYKDPGGGKLQVLGSLLEKFEATGLKTGTLYVRIYTRDRLTGGGAQVTGGWLRLWTAGDPNWGDAHHTFFMHQVQLWVKPAPKD